MAKIILVKYYKSNVIYNINLLSRSISNKKALNTNHELRYTFDIPITEIIYFKVFNIK